MPIRPENKSRYPKEWPQISLRIRERADQRCEQCGVLNRSIGYREADGTFVELARSRECVDMAVETADLVDGRKIVEIVLTVAHLDHTPENCADDNLKALCQRCHNRLDAPMRRQGIAQRARDERALGDLFGGNE